MAKSLIKQTSISKLDAVLLTALLPSVIIKDFKIQRSGIRCIFDPPFSQIQKIVKTFLSSLYEITGEVFYFKYINDREAILKIYSVNGLNFSDDILYNPSASFIERDRF